MFDLASSTFMIIAPFDTAVRIEKLEPIKHQKVPPTQASITHQTRVTHRVRLLYVIFGLEIKKNRGREELWARAVGGDMGSRPFEITTEKRKASPLLEKKSKKRLSFYPPLDGLERIVGRPSQSCIIYP